MISLRSIVIFLAGGEFFHTLSHVFLAYYVSMPIEMTFMTLTATMNTWAIVVNAVITLALLWWAKKLS